MKSKFLFLLALLLSLPSLLYGQNGNTIFGKNKMQYHKFTYYYIQSNHFDVYFTDGGEYLAEFTADVAESSLTLISRHFRYQINNRIPIVVYNSHNDFQQTNVIQEFLEEGIGGVTELFKNRIILPFEGNYRQFRHVIHHELVHAVVNDMFYGGSIQSVISNNIRLELPLWFNEGLAEYESLQWDTDSDMFLRDASISGYLPAIDYLNGYFAYRGGQSVWWHIANKYGEQKIGEILNRIKGTKSVEAGFKSTLGVGVNELSERWQKEQKVLYWPDIAKREEAASYARRLTNHTKDGNFYNSSPTISPQGDKIAFISDRDDYFDVFVMSAMDGQILDKVVGGQRTRDFEELHLLTPGMSWSPDGKRLALAAKSGDHDALFIIDVNSGETEKLEFDLDGIFSVDWSPLGDKLAFSGLKHQQSDIYVYDFNTKGLKNLTDDIFSDTDPHFGKSVAWSPDGKVVYFVSDRGDNISYPPLVASEADGQNGRIPKNFKMQHYNFNQLDIYSLNIETMEMKRVTKEHPGDASSPVISPDGKKLLFISDRNGINNIYEKDLTTGKERSLTNSLTGVYQLSISRDGNKLVFTSMNEAGFDIFLMKAPFDRNLNIAELEPTEFIKRKRQAAELQQVNLAKHDTTAAHENVVVVSGIPDSTQLYGENVKIDFRNFVFSEKISEDSTAAKVKRNVFKVNNNVDEQGNYKVNKYKVSFSPDIIYGNAGYSTFYGVQGTSYFQFSDLLGDHEILIATNLLIDLKNSDYAVAYYYLPDRIDYGVEAFHSARFLVLNDINGGSLYRFRTYGVNLSMSRPFDKYNRLDVTFSWFNLSKDNLDYDNIPSERRTAFMPTISLVHDNVLWGFTSPNNGSRYNLTIYGTRKLTDQSLSFTTFTGDFRKYFRLSRDYVFAFRVSGGASVGLNPQRFMIGGTDGWINRTFENGNQVPINSVGDFAFLTPVLPLRGFNYNAELGSKYALVNLELRYPLLRYLVAGPLPLAFQYLTGIAFIDVGSAWNENFKAFTHNGAGELITKDLLIGTGFGARMFLLSFFIRFDVAWQYSFNGFSSPKYYFSLGTDF